MTQSFLMSKISQNGCQCAKMWHLRKWCPVYWRPLNFNDWLTLGLGEAWGYLWLEPDCVSANLVSPPTSPPLTPFIFCTWCRPTHCSPEGTPESSTKRLGEAPPRSPCRMFRRSKRLRAVGNSIQGAGRSQVWFQD